MNPIFVKNIDNLYINVYIIGYSNQGESIILLIKELDIVIYSIVIDSYVYKEIHETIEILKQNRVNNIDIFCWSHPDEDHTLGINDIINSFCKKNTIFLLPQGVNGKDYDPINYSKESIEAIKTINSTNSYQNYSHYTVQAHPEASSRIKKVTFKDSFNRTAVLDIQAIAPISAVINRITQNEPEKIVQNLYSIALLILIGDKKFLFSGDIENQSIRQILDEDLLDIFLLKTPHHTSKSSSVLYDKIKYLKQEIPYSCTTVFCKHNLPDLELIYNYKNCFTRFHSTGTNEDSDINFGVIEYTYSLTGGTDDIIKLYGHAEEIDIN